MLIEYLRTEGSAELSTNSVSGLLPVFSDCYEWLGYGSGFRNEGGTVMLRVDNSMVQDGHYDFETRCDDEGWMTILARDAESGSELVSYLK